MEPSAPPTYLRERFLLPGLGGCVMEESEQLTSNSAAIERKHAAMLERLANRHQSRLAEKLDGESTAPVRSTQSFLSQFSQSKNSIESRLCQIRQCPDPTRKADLESISLEISSLEKVVAENSYFLPPYEVRNCLDAITQLRQSVDDITSLVIPKKKFSFKNKASRKPTVDPAEKDSTAAEADKKINMGLEALRFKDLATAPGYRNRENEILIHEFCSSSQSEGSNGEFTLSGLKDCEVRLKGCLRALFMDRLIKCKVYVGVVMGSVLIEGAEGCVFVLAAHQIRIHNAKDCDFYLQVRSRPIIEDCSGVRFSPYCLSYQGLQKDLKDANLDGETGNWANVDDFQWLRAVQSPNWSVLPESERMATVDI